MAAADPDAADDAPPRPHRPRPLPIGWMVLVIAGVLYLAGSNIGSGWVVILTAAMVGAVVLDLVAVWRSTRATVVALTPPGRAVTGSPAVVAIAVTRPDLGTTLQLSDSSGTTRTAVRASSADVTVPVPLARGLHRHVGAVSRSSGPLGLAAAVQHHTTAATLWCRPGTTPAAGRIRLLLGDAREAAAARRRGDDDVRGVREHTASDPRRAVHWRATARQGRLMVRELESTAGDRLPLAIAGGAWTAGSLDLACEVVASLAAAAHAAGHAVTVTADGISRGWGDVTWQALAALPPAAGLPGRPLGAGAADGALVVGPAPVTGGIVVGDVPLADAAEVARWLHADG